MLEKYGAFNLRSRIFPRSRIHTAAEFDKVVDSGVIDGYDPPAPFLSKSSPIVTMGSCFAQNVSAQLSAAGYTVFTARVTDHLFTPPALQGFVEALRDGMPAGELKRYWESEQEDADRMRRLIQDGATVIVTFGLSTVWVDKVTNSMILDPTSKSVSAEGKGVRALPDPARYEMRQMQLGDILNSMHGLISAIRAIGSDNKIILTLSPIPLALSASDQPVFVADCVSKSALRVALDELRRSNIADVYYFPSFEILRWFATMIDNIWYEDKLLSHIRHDWIRYTVSKFCQYYCTDSHATAPPLP